MRIVHTLVGWVVIFLSTSSCCLSQEHQSSTEKDSLLMNEIVAWKESLAIFESKQDYYKLARLYSRVGEPDSAIVYLMRSMELGYADLNILVDPDLANMVKYENEIREGWCKIHPNGNFDYALDLVKLEYADQSTRSVLFQYFDQFGRESDEYKQQFELMRTSDSLNIAQLESLIERNGWPAESKVGEFPLNSAFTLLLHAGPDVKKTYLPHIEKSVADGELPKRAFAYFIDKMKTSAGENQIYGTQITWNETTGNYELYPVEEEEQLNERRREMGLDSVETYLRHMYKMYNR